MKLLIISDMSHYMRNGTVVGWGPTVEELNHLASSFEEVRHIACLCPEEAPPSALPYSSDRVRLIPVPRSGGKRLQDKLGILRWTPHYVWTMLREMPKADIVHVRCPANIPLLAILLLAFLRRPRVRWVKYAGNWSPIGKEAWSYTVQRWWLNKGLHRGHVTVNGRWPGQPQHVRSFLNPCVSEADLSEGRTLAANKTLLSPIRLIYVGRVETPKGVGRILHIMRRLQQDGVPATLDIVGDGPERGRFEALAVELDLERLVSFHGWLPRPSLSPLYARSHIMLFPSSASEGWPKVLSEGMAFGVVPVASTVSSIPQYLADFGTGKAFHWDDLKGFAEAVAWYAAHPKDWKEESVRAVGAAPRFSYSSYVAAVRALLGLEPPHQLPAGR